MQYLFDDIHPSDWILFEFYNILLNLYADFKAGPPAAAPGGAGAAKRTRAAGRRRRWFS